ncbi:hypothetical protein Q8791_04945 [Nocardiopsis sp. CT-R113]|uniref:Lipoprotein n=1 Tax=Nocardiopsis codii TaxID=3065942 RepID=A0ABU7K3Y1_9ACTN|nr:hypothetical protein [Nocardiopsis sp. CT-R113]MEE2036569.1 hypothetical protein [Nocardiopsis sp. CT-R113]
MGEAVNGSAKGVIGAGTAALWLLTGCGFGADPGSDEPAAPVAATGAPEEAETEEQRAALVEGQATLSAAEHPVLGLLLTDGDGNTLYLFTEDDGVGPTCVEECAAVWEPLRTAAGTEAVPMTAEGVRPELVAAVPRLDGAPQVTYAEWPLYTYTGDAAPSEANGQGMDDSWFALDVYGGTVTVPADTPQG